MISNTFRTIVNAGLILIIFLNSSKKRNVEEIEAYKSEILSLQETVKILRSQNESLRQEISKKSPVIHFFYLHGASIKYFRRNLVDI